eukprot:Ihof_evm1s484 gene=Ihof_evmTU1s484
MKHSKQGAQPEATHTLPPEFYEELAQNYTPLILASIAVYKGAFQGYWLGMFLFVASLVAVPTYMLKKEHKVPINTKVTTQREKMPVIIMPSSSLENGHTECRPTSITKSESQKFKSPSTRSNSSRKVRSCLDLDLASMDSSLSLERNHSKHQGTFPPPAQMPITIKAVPILEKWEKEPEVCDMPTIQPNSREPVEFVTPTFKARTFIKFRTDPLDPVFTEVFSGKKRTFEFQIQGRFAIPMTANERLVFGVEVPDYLNLGLVGRGLVHAMISVTNRIMIGASSSMGDKKTGELPHVVYPIETTVDKLLITPDGETPPSLCHGNLPEGVDKKGRANLHLIGDTHHTYTFSMHGMYVDFVKWTLCNMPGMGSVDLRAMLGDLPIRLVGYIIPKDYNGPHTPDKKRYCFNFHLEHTGGEVIFNDETEDTESAASVSDTEDQEAELDELEDDHELHVDNMALRIASVNFKEDERVKITAVRLLFYLEGATAARGTWFGLEITEEDGNKYTVLKKENVHELSALNVDNSVPFPSALTRSLSRPNSSARALASVVLTDRINHRNMRFHRNERMQYQLDEYLNGILKAPHGSHTMRIYLDRCEAPNVMPISSSKRAMGINLSLSMGNVVLEGPVVRAAWETRWVENWAVLDSLDISIYGHYNLKAEVRIPLVSIMNVCNLTETHSFPDLFLEIHTLGRIYYLGFPNPTSRELWRSKLLSVISLRSPNSDMPPEATGPLETYTLRSTRRWHSERIEMNARRLFFLPRPIGVHREPNDLIEQLLHLVLQLNVESPSDKLIEYMDAASTLKLIEPAALAGLGFAPKLSFFLNLYHCLVAHNILVFGPPRGNREASSFFSKSSFEVAGEIFSLCEIEKNILDAAAIDGVRMPTKAVTSKKDKRVSEDD